MNKNKLKWYRAIILLEHDIDAIEVHWFPLEASPTRSTYSALTSISYFYKRLDQKDTPKGLMIDFENLGRVILMDYLREKRDNYGYLYEEFPHYRHNSLWDFYAAIGYDRKTKKWIEKPQPGLAMTRDQIECHCHQADPDFGYYKEYAVNYKPDPKSRVGAVVI